MNVLSEFDGISCLQLALERSGNKVDRYYASEIYKPAIKVTQINYPNTIQVGNVSDIDLDSLGEINLIGAGSPCQDISRMNKKKEGLQGKKSSLFYKVLEAKEKFKNAFFIVENVAGGTDCNIITRELKVRPLKFNSSWVTPQGRDRLYWTNIPVNSLPRQNKLTLSDLLESNVDDKYYQTDSWNLWWLANKEFQLKKGYSTLNAKKAGCLTARMYASWNGNFIQDERGIRRLTPIECERLQTIPDGYTSCISDNQAYHVLGDCWTIDIIAHILSHIPKSS